MKPPLTQLEMCDRLVGLLLGRITTNRSALLARSIRMTIIFAWSLTEVRASNRTWNYLSAVALLFIGTVVPCYYLQHNPFCSPGIFFSSIAWNPVATEVYCQSFNQDPGGFYTRKPLNGPSPQLTLLLKWRALRRSPGMLGA